MKPKLNWPTCCAILGLGYCFLLLVYLGWDSRFPQSRVFQQLNLRTLIIGDISNKPAPEFNSGEDVNPSYVKKDCVAFLPVAKGQQSDFLNKVLTECTNTVTAAGGKITGGEIAGAIQRCIFYQTAKTEGEIDFYATDIDGAKFKIVAIIFEARFRRGSVL